MSGPAGESRLIGIGLVIFVLVSIYFIIRSSGGSGEFFAPLSSFSPRPNGALALYQLLDRSGVAVEQHLRGSYHYPAGGAVVILDQSVPDASTMFLGGSDVKALTLWMKRGGTLVIAAGPLSFELRDLLDEIREQAQSPLHSTSYWLQDETAVAKLAAAGYEPVQAERSRSGLSGTGSYAILRSSQAGEIFKLEPSDMPLLNGVDEIEIARPEYAALPAGAVLLEADDPPQPVLSWIPVGDGELLWLSTPELASNNWIQRADNHRLLLNLMAAAARGRTLHFDEHRHGYREQRHNGLGLVFRTPGGQLMLLLLGLLALAFAGAAIAPARFMPLPTPPRRQSTEMVLAQASLYQRAGLRQPIARHLLDGLRHAVRQSEHLGSAPDDQRLSEWLHAAGKRGLPVDAMLLHFVDGKLAIASERQLWQFARACDRLRAAL